MNYQLPAVRIKRQFRASPLHELWQSQIVGQANYGYRTLTVLKQEDRVLKYGGFEVTGFHRFS